MVLRVCRRVLRDAHAAEDAFQATFLVLARGRGRSAIASCWATGSTGWPRGRRARRGSPRRGGRPRSCGGRPAAGSDRRAAARRARRRAGPDPPRGDRPTARLVPGGRRGLLPGGPDPGAGRAAAPAGREHRPRPARPGAEAARPPADPPGRRPGRRAAGVGERRRGWAGRVRHGRSSRPRGCPMRSSGPWPATPSSSRDPQARRPAVPSRRRPSPRRRSAFHHVAPIGQDHRIAAAMAAVGLGLTAATAAALNRRAGRGRRGRPPPAPDPRPAAEPASPRPQDSGEGRPRSPRKTQGRAIRGRRPGPGEARARPDRPGGAGVKDP